MCLDVLVIYCGGETRRSCSRPPRTTEAALADCIAQVERREAERGEEVRGEEENQRSRSGQRERERQDGKKKGRERLEQKQTAVRVCLCAGGRK